MPRRGSHNMQKGRFTFTVTGYILGLASGLLYGYFSGKWSIVFSTGLMGYIIAIIIGTKIRKISTAEDIYNAKVEESINPIGISSSLESSNKD